MHLVGSSVLLYRIIVPYISNREDSTTALSSNAEHQPPKDVEPCPPNGDLNYTVTEV